MASETDIHKLDKIVANAIKQSDERNKGYRSRALKMYPWICGRCTREFDNQNLSELTVHHRDHNHDNNPEDGSNWELLCIYCHDNEHSRYTDSQYASNTSEANIAPTETYNPFADLAERLKQGK